MVRGLGGIRSSHNLLTRTLRYCVGNEIAQANVEAIAAAYAPTAEIKLDSYDSPWRSLGLIFSLVGKPDLAHVAFDKAINWFETVLSTDVMEPTVLRGARLTMKVLCHSQASANRLSNGSLQEALDCFDRVAITDPDARTSRHLRVNYARLSFLANHYHLDDAAVFAERAKEVYKPSSSIHPSIQFLVEELDVLWRMVRFVVEVGDSDALHNSVTRVMSFDETLKRASLEGNWGLGRDLGVPSVLKNYLAVVDLCTPSPSEASQAVGAIVDFLAQHGLNPDQSIRDRAALLLARSIFSKAISYQSVAEFAASLQETISTCKVAAKRLSLADALVFNQISHGFTDFVTMDVMRFPNDVRGLNERTAVIRSICLAAEEAKISLRPEWWEAVTKLLLEDQEVRPGTVMASGVAATAKQFGNSLRMRIDQTSTGDSLPINTYLERAALSQCDKFLKAAVDEILSSQAKPNQLINSLKEASSVYIYARLKPEPYLFETALRCLQSVSSALAMPVLSLWILGDLNLEEMLWTRLGQVFESLMQHSESAPDVLPLSLSTLVEHNEKAALDFLFGRNTELQDIMLPVVCCALAEKEQLVIRKLITTAVAGGKVWSFEYEQSAREVVASLSKTVQEDSANGCIYDRAARQLVVRRLARSISHQPNLAPVVEKLLKFQVKTVRYADLEQQLVGEANTRETLDLDPVESVSSLSDSDAVEVLSTVAGNITNYTSSELITARSITLALLQREFISCQINEKQNDEMRSNIAHLFVQYLPPVPLAGNWSSRSWSGDLNKALSHDELFAACRHLLELLLSSQMLGEALATLEHYDLSSSWGLARWLSEIRQMSAKSTETGEAYITTCRACLKAILTSERKSVTYSRFGTSSREVVEWREQSDIPAGAIGDLILPRILDHAADIVSSLPQEIDEYHERRQLICGAVPVLASKGVLAPLCADLVARVPSLEWRERDICLAFIKEALRSDLEQPVVSRAIESRLKNRSLKTKWVENADLVSLLCGLPAETGNKFTDMFYKNMTPGEIIKSEKHWTKIEWIAREIKSPDDFITRLEGVINTAETLSRSASRQGQGLGAWATVLSEVCSKIGKYGSINTSQAEAHRLVEFANVILFGQRVEQLLLGSSRHIKSPEEGTLKTLVYVLDNWEQIAIELIRKVRNKGKLNCLGIAELLALREYRGEFEHVHEIVNTIIEARLALENPNLMVSCIEVCLRQQDLDGLETLFLNGLAASVKSSSETGAAFLAKVLRSFWHLQEVRLSMLILEKSLAQLKSAPHKVAHNSLKRALKLADEHLRLEFQNPPLLSL
jgi:hypothetical protein